MPRRLAGAGLLLTLAACGGSAAPPPAAATSPAAAPAAAAKPAVLAEAASPSLPLRLRVTGVHRIAGDVVRIELLLVNAATPDGAATGSPDGLGLATAVKALDGLSVLSADGRRRVFALRTPDGERVGSAPELPPPGESRGFWAAFPLPPGPIRLAVPGFPVLAGLDVVAPAVPAGSEP
jgi:hypothetical protein